MRIGINIGNPLLAGKHADSGDLYGIAVDLALELGRVLGQPVELVPYAAAGQMADAAPSGAWDVAFLAADPSRAPDITFTAPYCEIEATYLVPAGSSLGSLADVDAAGIRIAVADKSAYDLALRRIIQRAQLIPAAGVAASVDLFFNQQLDVLAGLRPLLMDVADAHPGCRVLDGQFTAVLQAIGAPRGRDIGPLEAFVTRVKNSNLAATLIAKHRIRGVTPSS